PRRLHSFPTRRSSDLPRRRLLRPTQPLPHALPPAHHRVAPSTLIVEQEPCVRCEPIHPPAVRKLTPPMATEEGGHSGGERRGDRSEEHTSELQSLAYL